MSARMPRCRGLWGLIFGHQFKDFTGQPYEFCVRCGMRAGGTPQETTR
jgi:hypothetical protein